MTRSLTIMLVIGALWCCPLVATAQPPTDAPPTDNAPMPIAPTTPTWDGVTARVDGPLITATSAHGLETWTLPASPNAAPKDGEILLAQHGETLAYCSRSQLFVAHIQGYVLWRAPLPGQCAALSHDGESFSLTTQNIDKPEWSETRSFSSTARLPAFSLGGNAAAALTPKLLATSLLQNIDEEQEKARPREEPQQATQQRHIEQLSDWATRDHTNPWYHAERARLLALLGERDAAERAYQATFEVDPAYQYELVGLAAKLDELSPELGERAFEVGLASMITHGYEPELNTSLIGVVIWLPSPEQRKDRSLEDITAADFEVLARHGDRLAKFAPRAEASAYFYEAMRLAAPRYNKAPEVWEERRDNASPFLIFGGPSHEAREAGTWINVLMACGLAFWLLFGTKLARTFFDKLPEDTAAHVRFNPLSRWDRGELVGMLGLLILSLYAAKRAALGVAIIGVVAAAPAGLVTGDLSGPAPKHYIDPNDGPASTFMAALAAQKRGELDEATELYDKLPEQSPGTLNNLGVIALERDDAAKAKQLFEQAKSKDASLTATRHNLDVLATRSSTPRTAAPSAEQWEDFWREKTVGSTEQSIFTLFETSSLIDHITVDESENTAWIVPTMIFYMVVLLAGAVGLFARREAAEHHKLGALGWALGSLVPGASRQYNALGPLVTSAFLTSLIMAYMLSNSSGMATNILDAIAIPAFSRYFGAGEMNMNARGALDLLPRSFANLWWVLLVGNLVIVTIAEVVRPDPHNPLIKKK